MNFDGMRVGEEGLGYLQELIFLDYVNMPRFLYQYFCRPRFS